MKHVQIFVIHDGIRNSVFQGQVLQPLLKKVAVNPALHITIVSFEKNIPTQQELDQLIPHKKQISIIFFKKFPFLGRITLLPAVRQLKKILKQFSSYTITARGPLAGWICMKALKKKCCKTFVVQARGLLAQEYQYVHTHTKNVVKKWWHRLRARQFETVEKKVYSNKNINFEVVSHDLANYLFKIFGANSEKVTVAADLPKKFEPSIIAQWKTEIRKKLNIPEIAHVYCFNGAIKPWQCPQQVISFFSEQLKKNNNVFLLILTQNKKEFQELLSAQKLPEKKYLVMTVAHKDIYQYLAACDTGLLFREAHIINWISRPTKALEYHAVGLDIIHNSTVGWLTKKQKGKSCDKNKKYCL